MIFKAAALTVDLTNTPLDTALAAQFEKRCEQVELERLRRELYSGEKINTSEDRAAHHTALRDPTSQHPHAIEARSTKEKVLALADQIRGGQWLGSTGQPIDTVVNIGIGGSDLGPRMIAAALSDPDRKESSPEVKFIANVDPAEMREILATCEQASTLFIIASKSFSTLETLENGLAARSWLLEQIPEEALGKHLIAVTANVDRAVAYGVAAENILPMWDWVGGRFSLWSAIGLPIAIAIGGTRYEQLLAGAHEMDEHFLHSPSAANVPVLMALLEDYYLRELGVTSLAVLPYSYQLRMVPDYLQQLCMESNGKSVTKTGNTVNTPTCPILWGSSGTVGQHSFHQLLHQGTQRFAVDFILVLNASHRVDADDQRQQHLVANCLAQSQAFTEGKGLDLARKELLDQGLSAQAADLIGRQKVISGGKPNTIIGMDSVNPKTLGALLSLYEHKTFVQSVLWGINAFDQWGVELGKQLSGPIFEAMTSAAADADINNESVNYWINAHKEQHRVS